MSKDKKTLQVNELAAENTSNADLEVVSEAAVDAVMKKYDRESNTRVWTGKPKMVVSLILAAFSLWCIWVTLFSTFLEEIRLTSFMGLIRTTA